MALFRQNFRLVQRGNYRKRLIDLLVENIENRSGGNRHCLPMLCISRPLTEASSILQRVSQIDAAYLRDGISNI
jgi:hypothetical protein